MTGVTDTSARPGTEAPIEECSLGDQALVVPFAAPALADGGCPVLRVPLTSPAGAPAASEAPWTLDVLESARRICTRSQALITESRETLTRLDAGLAALRVMARKEREAWMREAGQRAAAKARPGPAVELDERVVVGELTLLPLRTAVAGTGKPVQLTPAEWQLLATLVRHRDEVLGRTDLATRAWGPAFASRHSEVEVYVSRLRRKLARAGTRAAIRTVRGVGYHLRVEPEHEEADGGGVIPPRPTGRSAA
jgi:DNA-binding winged helix-turn-helix (wHTH) protein